MIENVIVTKNGSEADDSQNTIFSSSTPWENNGANLIVYLNGSIEDKNNYTIIDPYRLKFNTPIVDNDEIQFLITKLNLRFQSQVDKFDKKIQGKTQTSISKRDYEETIPSKIITHADEIWSSTIPETPNEASNFGVARRFYMKELTQDVTVSGKKGWYASSNGMLSGRIQDWIPPKFGQGYYIRLYDFNGDEIVSSDTIEWSWDYSSGYLTLLNPHNYTTPFKISGYQYIGGYGIDLDGVSHWKNPVPEYEHLPIDGNIHGDARIVLSDNSIWRWDGEKSIWIKLISSVIKESVQSIEDLGSVNSSEGDIRLVISKNTPAPLPFKYKLPVLPSFLKNILAWLLAIA